MCIEEECVLMNFTVLTDDWLWWLHLAVPEAISGGTPPFSSVLITPPSSSMV